MPKHKKPETYGELTTLIGDLSSKLDRVKQSIQNETASDSIPDKGEPASATFLAALVVPSDLWEC